MTTYTLPFADIDRSMAPQVGGKGANLGELARIGGVRVPDGCCVTTAAFRDFVDAHAEIGGLVEELARLTASERAAIGTTSARIRSVFETASLPPGIARAVADAVGVLGADHAYAVRSSATAEDLPTASFAGQHDSYLDVHGIPAVLAEVRRCWASLFTERAIAYRLQHGIDHRRVQMGVVLQRVVVPRVAGILFTADPLTSNRKVSSIDACEGFGDALIAGRVRADTYRVRDGVVLERRGPAMLLTDPEVVELERLGRTIEAHFGGPQDIEWCLRDGELHVVQSRPITTLYPLPEAGDQAPHVYLSVGHQQMMTDTMRPLGLAVWLLTTRAPMRAAGGRLFVDVAPLLASPARTAIVDTLGRWDPLTRDALTQLLARGFVPPAPPSASASPAGSVFGAAAPIEDDPAIVAGLIERGQASIAEMQREIATRSGPALFEFILEDLQELKARLFDPQSNAAVRAGMDAAAWLNDHVRAWLGDPSVADALSQSAPHNVTSEMGLALLDVADAVRPHPGVVAYLRQARDATLFEGLAPLAGGPSVIAALRAFLDRYGMRCAGEIDVTRTRWAEAPTTLVPLILGNVARFAPGERQRRFEQGQRVALAKERDVLDRLGALADGAQRAEQARQQIHRLRTFIGYREYPKYAMVRRYFAYREALLREAAHLASEHVIRAAEDVYFLTFAELHEVAVTRAFDARIVDQRRRDYAFYDQLAPPRVMTSEGEIVTGAYARAQLPAGVLVGIPVSTGVVEGRARVVARMEDAALEEGDILVTTFTDPSWTPLFVALRGLVTEVGGLMTHGAVIAREYGLPAVVGVEGATTRIADGQWIRVHGTDGYVELLSRDEGAEAALDTGGGATL